MESYRIRVSDLQPQFEGAVAWIEEGEGHRAIEIEGEGDAIVFMVSPNLIDYMERMEARIDSLTQR